MLRQMLRRTPPKRMTMKELVGNEMQYNKTLFFHVNVSNKSGIFSAIRYSACMYVRAPIDILPNLSAPAAGQMPVCMSDGLLSG